MGDLSLTSAEVLARIKRLYEEGHPLNKKGIKRAEPKLLQHALYYYPSWEHAIQEAGL